MRVGPLLDASRPVFLPDPVHRHHALNANRLAWWLTLPGTSGGKFLYDLMGLNPGTLTNMAAGSGWQSPTRPGGFGELAFDGSNDYALIPSSARISTASITLAAWIKTTTTTAAHAIIDRDDGSSNRVFQWRVDSGTPRFIYFGSGNSLIGTPFASTGVADGAWHRVAVTYNSVSGLVSFYRDGLPDGTSNSGSGSLNPVTSAATIGIFGDLSTDQFAGSMDDLTIIGRDWSAAEIRADYDISRRFHHGTLNRMTGSRLILFGTGTTARTIAFAATLGDQTLSAAATTAAPTARTASFAATLGNQTFASTVTTVTPSLRTVTFAATLGDQSLTSSVATAAPASRTASFAATLGDQTFASSVAAAAPGARTASFAATIADQTFVGSVTTAAPASRTAAFAATLGNQSIASSVTSSAPGAILAAFLATLADQSLAGSVASAAPAGRTASFAATLGNQSLTASATSAIPSTVTASFAATLSPQSLASSLTASAAPLPPFTGGIDPLWLLLLDGPATAVMGTSFAQAIEARWLSLGLDAVAGPIRKGRTFAGEAPPNTILTIARGGPALLTSTSSIREYRVTFKVRADKSESSHAGALALTQAFEDQALEWSNGWASRAVRQEWSDGAEPKWGAGQKAVYFDQVTYQYRVSGSR